MPERHLRVGRRRRRVIQVTVGSSLALSGREGESGIPSPLSVIDVWLAESRCTPQVKQTVNMGASVHSPTHARAAETARARGERRWFGRRWGQAFLGAIVVLLVRHGRIGGDARASLGGAESATRTRSLNGYAAIERITALNLSLRGRLNRYTAVQREGWLQSVALGLRPTPWLGFEASGGFRRETLPGATEERRISWYGMDLDVGIGRSCYVLLSGSRERGPFAAGDQIYSSLSYRF